VNADIRVSTEAIDMLAIHESSADRADRQGADFEGSLELLRELAVTTDVGPALPRLSAIVSKMLPHDALRIACFDERGRLVVNASTADVPDVTASELEEVIIDDLEAGRPGASAAGHLAEDLVGDEYRSALGVSTRSPEPLVCLAFWSKRPVAFNRAQVPLARWIAYHFGLGASRRDLGRAIHPSDAERARRVDAGVPRGLERVQPGRRGVGESAEWREVLLKATQVAPTDTTVLITGESGTGKEIVARFIHAVSTRKDGPFVALNCAALPEQLLESELFGHERGAFTNAHQAKPGQIELAAGGVLFLDEVGDMSKAAQAKLLRVLQEREFQRVGGTRTLKADIRILAATNRDLRKAVQRGEFREDLLYRLEVFDIHIPPLRERRADIVPLTDALLKDIASTLRRPAPGLARDARDVLQRHDWPGNVRELRNALERAAILAGGGVIQAYHLVLHGGGRPASDSPTDLHAMERDTILQVLREMRWNKSKAASRLGLSRMQLYGRMRKYCLEGASAAVPAGSPS
jgi:DNA-binding NtrC family response regulator